MPRCFVLALVLSIPALAQAQSLDQLAKATGTPKAVLEALKAERLFAKDVYQRRELLKDIAAKPDAAHMGLLVHIAKGNDDWPTQLTAVKLLSCVSLLADRDEVTQRVFPLLEANCTSKKKEGQLLRYSFDEVLRLNRWFRCDERLAPLLLKHYRGKDLIIRGFAYRGITQLKHPRLVEDMVLPFTWEVWKDKKIMRDSRRLVVKTFALHEVRDALPDLQKATQEGPIAITTAYALGRFLDPSSLKALRKIDKRAVHRLRMGAWLARTRLNDPKCLKEIVKVVRDHTEHDEIKRTFLGDLGNITEPEEKIVSLLKKLSKHKNPAVRLGAAMGLAKQGDAGAVKLLIETLNGPWPDLLTLRWRGHGWKRRFGFMESLLRIEDPAINEAVVAMVDVKAPREHLYDEEDKDRYEDWWRHGSRRREKMTDWYDEYRAEAASLCGERKIEEALPKLQETSKEKWGHIKFHALISQIELGDEKALKFLRWFLPKYDDLTYRQVKAVMGKTEIYTERMKWSTIFDVCEKFERVGDAELYVPLCEELLKTAEWKHDPMKKGWARKVRGGEAPAAGATMQRKKAEDEDPLFRPPEVAYLVRNQFARRRLVECVARLAGEKAAPQLARALRDSRATVRAAALVEIGRISKRYELHPGAGLQAERDVWPKAVRWLEEQEAWPE